MKMSDGRYRAENLTAPHYSPTRTVDWRGTHPGSNRQWRFSVEELERLYAKEYILLRQDGCPRKDGLKVYLDEAKGAPAQNIWDVESVSAIQPKNLKHCLNELSKRVAMKAMLS